MLVVFGEGATTLAQMLLAVDIGNTNVTLGVYQQAKLAQRFSFDTKKAQTEAACRAELTQQLKRRDIDATAFTEVIVASVVPAVTDVLTRVVEQVGGPAALLVGSDDVDTGLRIVYDRPQDVGADRLANAVAGYHDYGGAIVVDFGTATNFDCVSPDAEYLGGLIVPGVAIGLEALLARAARLRPVELSAPPRVLAQSTDHAVRSGVVHGYASLVDGLVEKLRAELAYQARVVATGGLAAVVAPHAKQIQHVDQDLTLRGLWLLNETNRGRAQHG